MNNDKLSASWRTRKVSSVAQSKSKGLKTKESGGAVLSPRLKIQESGEEVGGHQARETEAVLSPKAKEYSAESLPFFFLFIPSGPPSDWMTPTKLGVDLPLLVH